MKGNLPFLEKYGGQTTEELIALEGQYRTDSLVAAFEEAVQRRAEQIGTARLTEAERTVLAVAALSRIGCPKTAALTQRAIDALGLEGVVTQEAIESAIYEEDEGRSDELDRCDEEFYGYPDGDIGERLLHFIKEHRADVRMK